ESRESDLSEGQTLLDSAEAAIKEGNFGAGRTALSNARAAFKRAGVADSEEEISALDALQQAGAALERGDFVAARFAVESARAALGQVQGADMSAVEEVSARIVEAEARRAGEQGGDAALAAGRAALDGERFDEAREAVAASRAALTLAGVDGREGELAALDKEIDEASDRSLLRAEGLAALEEAEALLAAGRPTEAGPLAEVALGKLTRGGAGERDIAAARFL
ncbi:hypothetical protein T484DRAFT_1810343, partial [Baffinella frigidus]